MMPHEVKKSKAQTDIDSLGSVYSEVSRLPQQNALTVKERLASASRGLVDSGQYARRVIKSHKEVVESSVESVELAPLHEAVVLATRVQTAYLKDVLSKVDPGHPNFSRDCYRIRIRDALTPTREREIARLGNKKAWTNQKDQMRI